MFETIDDRRSSSTFGTIIPGTVCHIFCTILIDTHLLVGRGYVHLVKPTQFLKSQFWVRYGFPQVRRPRKVRCHPFGSTRLEALFFLANRVHSAVPLLVENFSEFCLGGGLQSTHHIGKEYGTCFFVCFCFASWRFLQSPSNILHNMVQLVKLAGSSDEDL